MSTFFSPRAPKFFGGLLSMSSPNLYTFLGFILIVGSLILDTALSSYLDKPIFLVIFRQL